VGANYSKPVDVLIKDAAFFLLKIPELRDTTGSTTSGPVQVSANVTVKGYGVKGMGMLIAGDVGVVFVL
jgi:hypothetical protein